MVLAELRSLKRCDGDAWWCLIESIQRDCVNACGAADVASCFAAPPRAILRLVALVKQNATYDDLCALPEHVVAEIIDGDLFASPRPASPHALASSMMGAALIGSFGDEPGGTDLPGGWWLLFEPELHFRRDVLVPDMAGWRRARMPTMPDVAAFELAPDWACEVISPSTGEIDRGRKMRVYAREQVAHLWIVDPILRTLEVYRLEDGRWVVASTHAGAEQVRAEPFAAIALDMRRWWREQ
jgi:Uma2 family endonuclease